MILVQDKIYIDLDHTKVSPDVFNVLSYTNPEYFQKMNMGFSVRNVPKVLYTGWIEGRTLTVLRGEALKIKPYVDSWDPKFDHLDHPVRIQYINNDFDLDEYQENAVQAIKGMRQGIVHAVTSAGKSLIILKACAELGQRALILVHRKILMEQLLKDINKYIRDENGQKISPGIIGDGRCTIGSITIGIDKTVSRNITALREQFGVVILDECHLAPAETISSIVNGFNSKYRFGFSGTLKRKDQKDFLIYASFGTVIATISKEQLLEKGRVVPVEVKIIESETKFDWDSVVIGLEEQGEKNPTQKARLLREQVISGDPNRRDLVLDLVARLPGKTMVISRYVEPCQTLKTKLGERFGIEAGIITGKDPKEAVIAYNAMKEGDLKVIFATLGCVSTGVSISDLDNIVLISPIYTNELLLHQVRGRLMRTAEGKDHGTLYYIYDQYIYTGSQLKKFIKIVNS